jgi:hypothetical protein
MRNRLCRDLLEESRISRIRCFGEGQEEQATRRGWRADARGIELSRDPRALSAMEPQGVRAMCRNPLVRTGHARLQRSARFSPPRRGQRAGDEVVFLAYRAQRTLRRIVRDVRRSHAHRSHAPSQFHARSDVGVNVDRRNCAELEVRRRIAYRLGGEAPRGATAHAHTRDEELAGELSSNVRTVERRDATPQSGTVPVTCSWRIPNEAEI